MQEPLAELLQLLELEPLEVDLFRGASRDIGSPQVFGGQVLGQALSAAYATVDGREVHSLHAYFLRRGDFNAPIVYQVDRSRDGGSFSSRRVVAIQHYIYPQKRQFLQYTTTRPVMHQRLGVADAPAESAG